MPHTLIVLSREHEYTRPLPPHFTHSTLSVWPYNTNSVVPFLTFQMRIEWSLDELANRQHWGLAWYGSKLKEVMNLVCPFNSLFFCRPVTGSHIRISPLRSPDMNNRLSGDQVVHRIWCLWPVDVCAGILVTIFQNRTAQSPPPLASLCPSGL